jgi:tape measure domain-containing protein
VPKDIVIRFLGDATNLQNSTVKVSSSMESLGSKFIGMGTLLAGGLAAGGIALGAFGLKAIQASADMEQTRIAFGTLLGGAKQADTFIRGLQAFAAKTPFEFAGLAATAKQLLAFGFTAESIVPTMTAVGDAVAALGGGQPMIDRVTMALGQMRAKGKVSAEEMMQLAEAGVPAWDFLAKKLGVDIPTAMKKVTAGAVDATTGIDALTTGMEARFGGLMASQSGTVLGIFSNLQDAVGQTMVTVGDSITKAFDVKAKLQGVLDLMSKLQGFAQGKVTLGEIVGPEAAASLGRVHETLNRIGEAIGALAEKVRPVVENLARLAIPHLDVAIIYALAAAFALLTIAAGAAAVAVIAATWPVLLIVAGVGILAAGIYLLVTHLGWARDHLAMLGAILFTVLGPIGLVVTAAIGLYTNWNRITNAVAIAGLTIMSFVSGVTTVVGGFFSALGTMAANAWSAFAAHPLYWIAYVAIFVPLKLAQLINAVEVWAVNLIGQGLAAAAGFAGQLATWLGALPGRVGAFLGSVLSAAGTFASQLPGWAAQAAAGFGDSLRSGLAALPGQMGAIGAAIIHGIWNGFQGLTGWLKGQIDSFVSGLVDGAKAAIGAGSPSRVFATEVGLPIAQGVALGIERGAATARQSLAGMFGGMGVGGPAAGGGLALAGAGAGGRSISVVVNGATLQPLDERRLLDLLRDHEILHS